MDESTHQVTIVLTIFGLFVIMAFAWVLWPDFQRQ